MHIDYLYKRSIIQIVQSAHMNDIHWLMAGKKPQHEPLNFFLWGTLRNENFKSTPGNIVQIEIPCITKVILEKVFKNLLRHALICNSRAYAFLTFTLTFNSILNVNFA